MQDTVQSYRSTATMGQSQLDLILQVYDGAIAAYDQAKDHFQTENFTEGREQMERAKKFVVHLYTTLNTAEGGEVAENLSKIYAFVVQQTELAVATKDIAQIDDIIAILRNLRLGWNELREQVQDQPEAAAEAKPVGTSTGGFTTSA